MAILKDITTEYGVLSWYWKITSIQFNLDKSYTIFVSGFSDSAARHLNSQPLKTIQYNIPIEEQPEVFSLENIYNFVKTKVEFNFNSIDC